MSRDHDRMTSEQLQLFGNVRSRRQPIATRKAEFVEMLAKPGTDDRTRRDIQLALSEVEELLTGNLDKIPKVVAAELNNWLEANQHLNEHHPA